MSVHNPLELPVQIAFRLIQPDTAEYSRVAVAVLAVVGSAEVVALGADTGPRVARILAPVTTAWSQVVV